MIDSEDYIQYKIARVDEPLLLSMQGLFSYSKDRLFSFILCGNVKVNEETVKDHTRIIKRDSTIALFDKDLIKAQGDKFNTEGNITFVSRGGNKLAPVLKELQIDVSGKICLDCGCATGGFTDCLLQYNAAIVHAVDVAYNILDYRLRIDSRVVVHERCNVLHLENLTPPPAVAVADLSFRTLRGIASHIIGLCEEKYLLALCKPQFEYVEYQKILHRIQNNTDVEYEVLEDEQFNGVLENKDIIYKVMDSLLKDLYKEGVLVRSIMPAGIKGRQGNQEYFLELIGLEGAHIDVSIATMQDMFLKYEVLLKELLEIV